MLCAAWRSCCCRESTCWQPRGPAEQTHGKGRRRKDVMLIETGLGGIKALHIVSPRCHVWLSCSCCVFSSFSCVPKLDDRQQKAARCLCLSFFFSCPVTKINQIWNNWIQATLDNLCAFFKKKFHCLFFPPRHASVLQYTTTHTHNTLFKSNPSYQTNIGRG